MEQQQLQDKLNEAAERLGVPGVAVGIIHEGVEHYAYAGVTSIENPLPVDEDTLFQFGSTGKTFTGTAVLRLVEEGKLELDAPVRRYLPDLKLKDDTAAEKVTVLQLLNHTAGWEGDLMEDTGAGDDSLARYVDNMAKIEQVTPVGEAFSYNNASLSLAGRLIEVVTGETYEAAMKRLIFEPLGLDHCYFFPTDIMTRRFVVGHNYHPDGTTTVARPWAMPRGNAPAGGISSNAADQMRWAKFHLGDGTAEDGSRILSEELLKRMQEPTVEIGGTALGDYVGISWMLRDIDGTRIVGHGGTTNGQHSSFEMVPAANFAVTSLSNSGPNGPELNKEIVRWALEAYLGVTWRDVEPVHADAERLAEYVGDYDTIAMTCHVTAAEGRLLLKPEVKPELRAQLQEAGEDPDDTPPYVLGLLEDKDKYVIAEGAAKGMTGYFTRGPDGTVDGVHIGGRLAKRLPAGASAATEVLTQP
jgi:CubicO group peptidase (beta-lactamase class C family)